MIKKIIIIFSFMLFFSVSFSIETINPSKSSNFPYKNGTDTTASDNTNMGKVIKEDVISDSDSVGSQIRQAFGVDYTTKDSPAIYYASMIINYFLGIVSFVALAVMIYGFYFMFFWANDEETFSKAKKYVGLASLSLLLMGVSWFVISWFFHVVTVGI